MRLAGKKILLGVTAGIAAYKMVFLVRLLKKQGALVQVVMTPSAKHFVTPLTLATLSENAVLSDFFNESDGVWNDHVKLGLWADLFLIAPATANTIAKMAQGHCDNLLLAVYLSARCPVYFAPAMDLDMYRHPAVWANIKCLQDFGHVLIPAQEGALASGLEGKGRMEEPEQIIAKIASAFDELPLKGKKVLVTAGPTYENIDPVRFIGNHSSGKMGFALAKVAADLGAAVFLVTGPTDQILEHPYVQRLDVVSTVEMHEAVHRYFSDMDIAIFSAAVADYRPKNPSIQKIKKATKQLTLELIKTVDILQSVNEVKKDTQFVVGFALETFNELAEAVEKARRKKTDLMVLNSLNDTGAGFGIDTNKVVFIDGAGRTEDVPLMSKAQVARAVFDKIKSLQDEMV